MSIPGLPSLKEFVEAMSVAWPVAFATCAASSAVLYANHIGISYVADIWPGALTTLFILSVFSAAILLTSILQALISAISYPFRWWQRQRVRNARLELLHSLPGDEHYLMSYMASYGKQAFDATFGHENLVSLVQKGLVICGSGQHQILHWPYAIPDYIWEEMRTHPEEFCLPDAPYHRNPLERF